MGDSKVNMMGMMVEIMLKNTPKSYQYGYSVWLKSKTENTTLVRVYMVNADYCK